MTVGNTQCSISYFDDANVQEMKKYIQHGSVTTYDHCRKVTDICLSINSRLKLKCDEEMLMEIGMLHDLYMYDWHDRGQGHSLHGFYHPRIAADNASRLFNISDSSYDAILCHMWPLTITRVPGCREAWLLCIADKLSALLETFQRQGRSAE